MYKYEHISVKRADLQEKVKGYYLVILQLFSTLRSMPMLNADK